MDFYGGKRKAGKERSFSFSLPLSVNLSLELHLLEQAERVRGEKRGSRDRLRRRIVAKRLLSCALVAAQGGEDYFSILLLLLRFVPTASLL